jgi:hypothetical protein
VKTSTFVKGLIVCVAAMIAMGGVLGLLNHGRSRPEGVAENWLTAVGDTTRKGVEADARERAEKIGPIALAVNAGLLRFDARKKSAFEDLEVGKAYATRAPGVVRLPFRVHARNGGKSSEISGVIVMRRVEDAWDVYNVHSVPDPGHKLPSEGGPPPSSAPASLWLAGLVGAAVIGLITTALVRAATP